MNKNINLFTIIVFVVYAILIAGIAVLYRFDSNFKNKEILTEFIANESEFQYKQFSEPLSKISSSNLSISAILEWYGNIRFEMEQSADNDLKTKEDIDERVSQLLPEDIQYADGYISPLIYTYTYYDVLASLDKDSEDYWELAYTTLFNVSIHQYLLGRNPTGWLYDNCRTIAFVCVIVLIVVFSITVGELIVYYLKMLRMKSSK